MNKCGQKVHQGCLNDYRPTDAEVENARIYIQERFMKSPSPPKAKPCAKLTVKKNFKCMTEEERDRLINVLKKLYANGFMWKMAEIHSKCWVSWHKSLEGPIGHRWFAHEMEMAIQEIDPDITVPYWVFFILFKINNETTPVFLDNI